MKTNGVRSFVTEKYLLQRLHCIALASITYLGQPTMYVVLVQKV